MASLPRKNVFVIGLDPFNRKQLEQVRRADEFRFIDGLPFDELKQYGEVPYEKMRERAKERIEKADVPVDAIMTFWDFPATLLVADLTDHFRLPGPSLESALRCEHKFWARLVQRDATDAARRFEAVNPFDEEAVSKVGLSYPFWIKPIKGTDSVLGFRIESDEDLEKALQATREEIPQIAAPFNEVLKRVELPEEARDVDGSWCIAEEIIEGTQHTASGFVLNGDPHVYGVIDSVNYSDSSSFFRYEYPSSLDNRIQQRIAETSVEAMKAMGLDQSAFNIEYFYNKNTDDLRILEINPRISQSHSDIYKKVDGETNEAVALSVSLGEPPDFPRGDGQYRYAAKFYQRRFRDRHVEKAPSPERVEALEREFDALINVEAESDTDLSDMREQDSYSYVLAEIFVGADSRKGLVDRYEEIKERLSFDLSEAR